MNLSYNCFSLPGPRVPPAQKKHRPDTLVQRHGQPKSRQPHAKRDPEEPTPPYPNYPGKMTHRTMG